MTKNIDIIIHTLLGETIKNVSILWSAKYESLKMKVKC